MYSGMILHMECFLSIFPSSEYPIYFKTLHNAPFLISIGNIRISRLKLLQKLGKCYACPKAEHVH